MFCDQCGAELPDDSVFCPKCGAKQAPIEEAVNNAPGTASTAGAVNTAGNGTENAPANMTNMSNGAAAPEKPKKKKGFPFVPVIIIGILLAAVIVALAIFLPKGKTKDGVTFSEKSLIFGDGVFLTIDGKKLEVEDIDSYASNYDATVISYLTEEGTLYVVDSSLEPVEIAKDVSNMEVSYSGSSIAYTVGDDYTDTTLYVYQVKKDNSVKVDTGVYASNYLISPNGKQIAYVKDYEGSSDNTLYTALVGKEGKKVDKDGCLPLAIGDNGKSFFYTDASDSSNVKLYLYDGKDSEKVSRDVAGSFYFNNSVSELLFTRSGSTYFYRIGMDEPSKVAGDVLTGVWNYAYESAAGDYSFNYQSSAVLVNRSKLTESVFATSSDVCYLSKDGHDSAKLCSAEDIKKITVAENGKSLIYLKDGKMYKVTNFGIDREETELYEGEETILSYRASRNLSEVYVMTADAELCYCKGKKKLVRISNDFTDGNDMAYNEAAKTIFYIEDNNLYSADKSGKKKNLIAENVTGLDSYADGIVYRTNEDGDTAYYYVKKGDSVKLMEY